MGQNFSEHSSNKTQQNLNLEEEVFVFPASFAQKRLWFIDQFIPGQHFYNVPTALKLEGNLNLAALEQTLEQILCRHEILRTNFKMIEGEVMQMIIPALTIPLRVINLEGVSPEQQETEAMRLLVAECERPFNLSSEPLLRVLLFKLNQTQHILLINFHHIICDDWSIGIFIRELATLYTNFVSSEFSTPLPELPLQYADFSEWQNQWLQGEILENQLSYWRKQLQGISKLNLPSDRPKPLISSYQGAMQYLELSPALTEALEQFSQQEGTTLFMTLLAAFQTLLYRYTHQTDIVVGSPIANRNRSEIEHLIGFFVNTLVLRTDLSQHPTFRELLGRVKEVTLGAYSHQDLPFEKLVEELQPERSSSENPLFQVVFGYENAPMETLDLPNLKVSSLSYEQKTTRFDLEFHLWKSSGGFRSLWGGDRWQYSQGIRGVVVYNTDLFDADRITRMIEHFKILLNQSIDHPQEKVSHLPILTETEQHQLLTKWNQTQTDYLKTQCIHHLFEAQVQQHPDAIAVRFSGQSLTYQELSDRSNQLAHYLKKLGVNSEVIVGICLKPSLDMIIAMLAILKAGGAYLPLDPSYPSERLNFMVEDAKVSILVTHSAIIHQLQSSIHCHLICLDKEEEIITQETTLHLINQITPENLAYIIYTSGSTGQPKGVAVPHKAVIRLVNNTNYINLTTTDKIAQVSNISFDAATFEIWGALLNGAELIGIDRNILLSPEEFARQLEKEKITVLFLTTALFQQMVRIVPQAFATLRYLLFGGEIVDLRWVRKLLKYNLPQHFIHVYGPTENTTFSSYYLIKDLPESITSLPIGRPISNTTIYLLDQQLNSVPVGIVGEIYLGGDGLARGYLNRPELTAEKFIFHPIIQQKLYKTGDLASYLPDGNVKFMSRIDDQVKIRGFRIELGEIEAILSQHSGVVEAVVTVQEEIPGEKQLIAYIIASPKPPITNTELRKFLKQKLPDYMIPSAYLFLDSFPLTPNGKINRNALPKIDALTFNSEENYVAPGTEVEAKLVKIWTKILGKEQLGIHDNFFELGGHSLLATQLVSRIRDTFKIELSVRNLFESPTVAGLAMQIETIYWAKQSLESPDHLLAQREDMEF